MLAEILKAVTKTAKVGIRAYAETAGAQPTSTKRRKRRKGCTPCAAIENAVRTENRARNGQL